MILGNLLGLIACGEYVEIFNKQGIVLEKGIVDNIFTYTIYQNDTVNLIETFEGVIQITLNI